MTLIQNLLGLAAGAFVAGVLSDALGLQNALALIPLASLGAALLFIIAARSYEADKQRLADIHLSVDDAAPGRHWRDPPEGSTMTFSDHDKSVDETLDRLGYAPVGHP